MSAVPLIAGKASSFVVILFLEWTIIKIGMFYFPEKPPVAPNVVAQASNKHSILEVCTPPTPPPPHNQPHHSYIWYLDGLFWWLEGSTEKSLFCDPCNSCWDTGWYYLCMARYLLSPFPSLPLPPPALTFFNVLAHTTQHIDWYLGVFTQIFGALNYSNTQAGNLGFGNTIAALVGGFLAGPIMDKVFKRRYKLFLLLVFACCSGSLIWFTLR